jgi:Ca2+-binding RTX toxin-like protein
MPYFVNKLNQSTYQATGLLENGLLFNTAADQIVLFEGATISASNGGDGILGGVSSSGSYMLLSGSVLSADKAGIYAFSGGHMVSVSSSGVVFGKTGGIVLTAGGNMVENRGIVGSATAAGISAALSNNYVTNLGSISGALGVVAGSFGSANNVVVNSGSITSTDVSVTLHGDGSSLTNSGLIRSTGFTAPAAIEIYASAGETVSVVNTGTIESYHGFGRAIWGSNSSDRITNQGEIRGGIDLDMGNDLYDGRGGTITGYVSLGHGNDTAYGGGGDETFADGIGDDFIDGGSGIDTVIVKSFALPSGATRVDLRITTPQLVGVEAGRDRFVGIENLTGGDGDDEFIGTNGANTLFGDGGVDTLEGGLGNDVLDGGVGFDYARFTGSTGARVSLTKITAQATGYGTDKIINIEGLIGGSGGDNFIGDGSYNQLIGNAGNDSLSGGDGDDILRGGTGNDRLTGGTKEDSFVFNTALNAKTNVDTITDFKRVDDTFRLENAIFKKLVQTGNLSKSFFVASTKAKDKDDYVVYDKATGALYYDIDGSGKGAAVKFAQLTKGTVLAHDDLFVI